MRLGIPLMILLLAQPWELQSQGSLIYVPHHQGNLISDTPQLFDLDQDGEPEISVQFVYQQFGLDGSGAGNYQAELLRGTRMITDHRYFGSASLLESGMTIDSEGIPARTSRSSPPDSITPYNWVNQAVSLGVSLGGASGDALGNRTEWGMVGTPAAIFGLQIYDGQNYRNAWLRVEAIPLPSGGNHYRVADWAYSPEPGAAVFAGITQVPEPTTATLLLSGLACILAAVAFTFLPGRVDQERPLDPPAAQK